MNFGIDQIILKFALKQIQKLMASMMQLFPLLVEEAVEWDAHVTSSNLSSGLFCLYE